MTLNNTFSFIFEVNKWLFNFEMTLDTCCIYLHVLHLDPILRSYCETVLLTFSPAAAMSFALCGSVRRLFCPRQTRWSNRALLLRPPTEEKHLLCWLDSKLRPRPPKTCTPQHLPICTSRTARETPASPGLRDGEVSRTTRTHTINWKKWQTYRLMLVQVVSSLAVKYYTMIYET